ncbi:uncharacterized protein C19orf47 [Cimex lectularius]|uniref:SAM domain-containing protein n=1 Tax=Cimex lectularius TaxID=79782 RepID=A0A8I6RFG7_CIMLE|nr:uncharacterized protein C19orf47 [Cimex lectularius]
MKQDCSASSWLKFFTTAGIPKEFAETYAVTFSKNQINLDMLPEIKKEYLVDMGINLMGHIIAILRHAKTVHEETIIKATLTNGTKVVLADVKKDKPIVKPTLPSQNKTVKPETVQETKLTEMKVRSVSTSAPQKRSLEEDRNPVQVKMMKITNATSVCNKKPVITPTKTKSEEENGKESENRKRVFLRLGNETSTSVVSEGNSNGESVFSRLGGKAPKESPVVRTAILKSPQIQKTVKANSLPKSEQTIKFNDVLLRQRQPYQSSLLLNKLAKGTMRADETLSSIVRSPLSTNLKNKPTIKNSVHARLGKSKMDQLIKAPTTPVLKQVRFGGITEKTIPRERKPIYRLNNDQYEIVNSVFNKGSIGMSTGVFSRLGI